MGSLKSKIWKFEKKNNIAKEFAVRALSDNVQKIVRALMALEQPVDQWDALLLFTIREKLNHLTLEK